MGRVRAVVAAYAVVGERVALAMECGESADELAAVLRALAVEMEAVIAAAVSLVPEMTPAVRDETLSASVSGEKSRVIAAVAPPAPVVRDETLVAPVSGSEGEARAIVAAARLVPSDRASRVWDLVTDDGTVIGHVGPARTGRGWEGWAAGAAQESAWRTHRTRQTAGYDAGAAWVQRQAGP